VWSRDMSDKKSPSGATDEAAEKEVY